MVRRDREGCYHWPLILLANDDALVLLHRGGSWPRRSAADVLVAELEIPVQTVTAAAVAARAAGTRVILNAAPARDLPPELLAAVDLLVVNEGEAQALTGRGREEPRALLDLAPRAVLTLGGEGAWYVDRDGTDVHVPAVTCRRGRLHRRR